MDMQYIYIYKLKSLKKLLNLGTSGFEDVFMFMLHNYVGDGMH